MQKLILLAILFSTFSNFAYSEMFETFSKGDLRSMLEVI